MNAYKELFDGQSDMAVRAFLLNINWADLTYLSLFNESDEDKKSSFRLRPKHSEEDLQNFITWLKTTDYDEGYGTQELHGIIAMKDNTWYSRHEYDGAEWWIHNKYPTEPKWD